LVGTARIRPHDLVLDIGAGGGTLTSHLVSCGARVIAVELHPARARRLRRRFDGQPVVVVQADAADLRLPRRPFAVVANPPFAVTTALLRRLLGPGSHLQLGALVVPTHVGARWAAGRAPGRQRWSRTFQVTVETTLPARAFRPAAPLGAAVLRIERRGAAR
jgi:23S rRNA (adenine-N6)-dimethyltransferase